MFVKGIVSLPISILGRKTMHPFRVISGLNESVILGADFINKHLLVYDPKIKQVNLEKRKKLDRFVDKNDERSCSARIFFPPSKS